MSTASASISARFSAREPHGFDRRRRLSGFLPAGPGPVVGQTHCRALGLRSGRLSGRRLSAGLGRVERPLSRHRAIVSGRATTASLPILRRAFPASGDLFNRRGRKPWASVNFITAHDGFTLERSRLVRRETQRSQRRGQSRRHSDNKSWNYGAEGPTDDPDNRGTAGAAETQFSWHAAVLAGHADDPRRATNSAAPSAATTTPIARTTRFPGSTGTTMSAAKI